MNTAITTYLGRRGSEKTLMNPHDFVSALKSIVERERESGCPMACESLIEPALRRWKSYDRRNTRNKDKSLEHRVIDLTKGLIALFPDHGYDKSCLTHLAQSFAIVLRQDAKETPPMASHEFHPC